MKAVFRVDSSIQMGLGHLMRCLALADELKKQKKNHNITFICRELNGNSIELAKHKHTVITLPKNENFQSDDFYLKWLGVTQDIDAKQTIENLPENTDCLIVDSYALDEKWHKQLRLFVNKIIVIDDLADRKFDCDIIINQNLGAKKQDYQGKKPKDCQLLLGCEFALLRPEFSELRAEVLIKRKNTKKIKNILISVGGSDKDNLTYDALQNISNDFNVVVVLGNASPHNQMIQNYAQGNNIKVIINADNMAELMSNADLAIGAGGSTSWERCCLGLPTLLFVTADNQKPIAVNLEKLGAVKIIDNLKYDLETLVDNFSLWKKMSKKAQDICDGLGAKRIKI